MEGTVETFNRQFDKDKLEVFKERVEALRKENDILKLKHEKSEKETHEFVAYFQREMEKKDDMIAILNETVIRKDNDAKREIEELKAATDARIAKMEEDFDGTDGALRTRLKVVDDELAKLEAFRDKKATLEKKLEVMAEELKQNEVKHIEELNAMERKYLEEKSRLVKETEKRIIEIKTQSREAAQSGLDADTRKIVTDNRRMGEELRFQLQTTGELQKEKARLEEETRRLQREVVLQAEKEKVYAKQGHRQAKEIKELQNKVKSLERSLSQVVRDFEKERRGLVNSTQKELEEQTLDAQALRNLVKLKNKELKTVKKLAQTILDQRTEVEQYFLEALEQVKAEKRRERDDVHKKELADYRRQVREANSTRSVKFPTIRPSALSSLSSGAARAGGMGEVVGSGATSSSSSSRTHQLPTAPDLRVDLRDLSWEDREHVLRLLFAKINNVQGFVDVAPSHSFEGGAAAGAAAAAGGGGGFGFPEQPLLNNPPSFSPAAGVGSYSPQTNYGGGAMGTNNQTSPGHQDVDVNGFRPPETTSALDVHAARMPGLE